MSEGSELKEQGTVAAAAVVVTRAEEVAVTVVRERASVGVDPLKTEEDDSVVLIAVVESALVALESAVVEPAPLLVIVVVSKAVLAKAEVLASNTDSVEAGAVEVARVVAEGSAVVVVVGKAVVVGAAVVAATVVLGAEVPAQFGVAVEKQKERKIKKFNK